MGQAASHSEYPMPMPSSLSLASLICLPRLRIQTCLTLIIAYLYPNFITNLEKKILLQIKYGLLICVYINQIK